VVVYPFNAQGQEGKQHLLIFFWT